MPAPPRFTHNAFPTARLDACVRFYEDFAGMRVVHARGAPGDRVRWLAPAGADVPIFVLIERPDPAPPSGDSLLRHLGFELDTLADLRALHARLAAAGLDPTPIEHVDDVVGHVTFVRDPDGRQVEFSFGQNVGA